MRAPHLLLMPALLLAQRAPGDLAGPFEQALRNNRIGTLLVLQDDGQAWAAPARQALQQEALLDLNLPVYQASGRRNDPLSTYLRDRYGWAQGARWALVDPTGRVLVESAKPPTPATVKAAVEQAGLKSRAQELEEFLRRTGDHLEARTALLREYLANACRRTRMALTPPTPARPAAPPPPAGAPSVAPATSPQLLPADTDRLIWGQTAEAFGRLIEGPWMEALADLPWALTGPEAAHSPLMRELWSRFLPVLEDALKRQPTATWLWRVWAIGSDLTGGRPLVPLLASLEPLPGTAPEDWPPAAVLEPFIRDARKRGDWRTLKEVLEPRWEEWRRSPRRQGPGPGGPEAVWNRLLQPLLEACLALGESVLAEGLVAQAAEVLPAFGVPARAAGIATRMNRPDLALRWGGPPPPPRPR